MEKFWQKVDKTAPNGCWNWMAGCTSGGYGEFWFGKKIWSTHRLAWWLTYGYIPKNKMILHKCDNRRCVNPEHLYPGTNTDNMRDRLNRGKCPRGETHPNSKMTVKKVIELRQRYAAGNETVMELGLIYGMSQSSVSNIINKVQWGHI